ncbi:hypothetical protein B0H13DRAFT_1912435 [Mycena leptocephala]|nr:hypothetical protein B0H13DRAFT_1912435 [Mycena leptocephala]
MFGWLEANSLTDLSMGRSEKDTNITKAQFVTYTCAILTVLLTNPTSKVRRSTCNLSCSYFAQIKSFVVEGNLKPLYLKPVCERLVSTASPSFFERNWKGEERGGGGERGNGGEKSEKNENAQHKRRQTYLDSKQPEQHDELEPKRDLPHAYGLGAREFRVEMEGRGKEDDRREREEERRTKNEEPRDALTINKITNHHPNAADDAVDDAPRVGEAEAAVVRAAPRAKMGVKSTGSRRTRRLRGDGLGLGRYGLVIRFEQAEVFAEERLRDHTACDPAFVSLPVSTAFPGSILSPFMLLSALVTSSSSFAFVFGRGKLGRLASYPCATYPIIRAPLLKFDQMRGTPDRPAMRALDGAWSPLTSELDFLGYETEGREGGAAVRGVIQNENARG